MTASNQTQQTPGPWRVNRAGHGTRAGGFIVDEIYVYAPECGVDDIAIAADIIDPRTGKFSEANATLIAAAPDLLAAAKCALSVLFLLTDEVKALGCNAKSVQQMLADAIAASIPKEPT